MVHIIDHHGVIKYGVVGEDHVVVGGVWNHDHGIGRLIVMKILLLLVMMMMMMIL